MEKLEVKVNTEKKATRRKFLTSIAKTAPVITAIAAAPVWATGNANSSHQSAGMSATSRVARFNGFSPGYFHEHKNKAPKRTSSSVNVSSSPNATDQCQTIKGGSKLPAFYYDKFYGGPGGIFPDSFLAAQVRDVLSPSNWKKGAETANINGHSVTQVDRFMLTAYLNADPLYGAMGYPYTQEEIRSFCKDYEQGRVAYRDAKLILTNLIHEGQEDMGWEADTVC